LWDERVRASCPGLPQSPLDVCLQRAAALSRQLLHYGDSGSLRSSSCSPAQPSPALPATEGSERALQVAIPAVPRCRERGQDLRKSCVRIDTCRAFGEPFFSHFCRLPQHPDRDRGRSRSQLCLCGPADIPERVALRDESDCSGSAFQKETGRAGLRGKPGGQRGLASASAVRRDTHLGSTSSSAAQATAGGEEVEEDRRFSVGRGDGSSGQASSPGRVSVRGLRPQTPQLGYGRSPGRGDARHQGLGERGGEGLGGAAGIDPFLLPSQPLFPASSSGFEKTGAALKPAEGFRRRCRQKRVGSKSRSGGHPRKLRGQRIFTVIN
ncbi:uncharacterized protein LOC116230339, partial [Phasianus colchicus]|uniref:uncharacterized protein LOC116230339 n=1 Tax=Phasianus colchicus TaxID=9054 RepID=UPI00129EAAC4